MNQQAFLDGIRQSRGMGMGDTRNAELRSADQDQTHSGNPRTVFNSPRFVNNKQPVQSFDHNRFQPPQMVRGGRPGTVAQMPPQQQQSLPPQQQGPFQNQGRFMAPTRFTNNPGLSRPIAQY